MATKTQDTQAFYDGCWPLNVPDYRETEEHVRAIVPSGTYERALDGGTGVCSLALAGVAGSVTAVDISAGSLRTASQLAQQVGVDNVRFVQASLLDLPFPPRSYALVFSWGVIHHTVDPLRALDELVRLLRPGGTLVLAVYRRTWLTPAQEMIRHLCLRSPRSLRQPIISGVTSLVRLGERLGAATNVRADNGRIESQVEDWFFVPEKHFFAISEMEHLFQDRGLSCELVCAQTGRFKSSSNFVVRGSLREGNAAKISEGILRRGSNALDSPGVA